jgi:hypothetical protein
MNNESYILDVPLPPEQDFATLKEKGLDFIRTYSGSEWSNLNSSDPGITILDQLCFALTELGYCGDFPLGDLLTGENGKLKIKDQFYLPEQMLSTSPVTIADYIKYITDEVPDVKNAIIIPQSKTGLKQYQVYLLTDDAMQEKDPVKEKERMDAICSNVYFVLNKCRNIGELFRVPMPLHPVLVLAYGSLAVEQEENPGTFLRQIQQAIQNYIFPPVVASGFDQLSAQNLPIDEIINGPNLKNGWIPTESAGDKKNSLRVAELNQLLEGIKGIAGVNITAFNNTSDDVPFTEIQVALNQLINIDLAASIQSGTLNITYRNISLQKEAVINSLLPATATPSKNELDTNVMSCTALALPDVKFRDVNDYYSIQNTFPEIYAAGADAVTSNASDYQVAQSRQLKGYLTLFDQVLANQFAQLANIDKLFSFKNFSTAAPSDRKRFYTTPNSVEKYKRMYPVPYKTFSPTYFYQSLYEVPHIKPLLKNNDTFSFDISISSEPAALREQKAWEAYQLDPYNPYIRGLMECVDDEPTNLSRRNEMLDHLLARYGESPLLINEIIDGSKYSGNRAKDRVIFKSLYLQNLGHLSYYRMKGMNCLAANTIKGTLPVLPETVEELFPGEYTKDFIINSARIDREEKITEHDFASYSAIELKLNLLFGLKTVYRNFIINNWDDKATVIQKKISLWMIQQRRGVICIETGLLQYFLNNKAPEETTSNEVVLIFPSFTLQQMNTTPLEFNTISFRNRLNLFLENSLPVSMPFQYYVADEDAMQEIIPAYATWINSLRFLYKEGDLSRPDTSKISSEKLTAILTKNIPGFND